MPDSPTSEILRSAFTNSTDSARLKRPAEGSLIETPMPCLAQLLVAHPSFLLVDTSSARVQVGLWAPSVTTPRWHTSEAEAGTGLFACVEALLAETGLAIGDLNAFAFCEGPGSILGIRTAAVALRTWQVLANAPIYSFRSLDLAAHFHRRTDLTLIADARRDRWHVVSPQGTLSRIATNELRGALGMPEGFRHWTPLPANVERVSYDLTQMLPATAQIDLFRTAEHPDAFLHEDPAYALWTPRIHQAER